MNKIQQRLYEFIQAEELSVPQFERRCGLETGYVKNFEGSFEGRTLDNIQMAFPRLSTEWLISGSGSMRKQTENHILLTGEEGNERVVSPATAERMKTIGFHWPCRVYYLRNGENDKTNEYRGAFCKNHNEPDELEYAFEASAPTLSNALKWLREEKGIAVNINCQKLFEYSLQIRCFHLNLSTDYLRTFRSFEDAQEAGIDEALEILSGE